MTRVRFGNVGLVRVAKERKIKILLPGLEVKWIVFLLLICLLRLKINAVKR